MTPDQIAKNGSEHAVQSALFAWAAVAQQHGFEVADLWAETNDAKAFLTSKKQGVPELRWLHAVPNGGSRGDNEKSRKIRGSQMKAEGVRDGAIAAGIEAARRAGVQMPDDATKAAIASLSIAPNKNPA